MLDSVTPKAPRAAIIGAGFGGLAAAVRLARKGYAVEVFDKLDAPGGRASVFRQDGFVFDAGPTIITAPFVFEALWDLCGERMADHVDLRPVEPFYVIRFDDGDEIRCSGDNDLMREEIARFSKDDAARFDAYLKESRRIYDVAFERMGREPFGTLSKLVTAMPDLVRLGGHLSVHQLVAKYFKHPKVRIAFSFHPLLVGGNPFATTACYCLIAHLERAFGVHYAMGGTGALVKALTKLAERQGVVFHHGAAVDEILTEKGRVTGLAFEDGGRVDADIVVSNADAAWTYRHLLRRSPRKRWTDAKVDKAAYSMSLFVWYFGTNRRYEDVHHHVKVLGPRYRGLLDDIFKNHTLAEDFSLYLHRPSATDPSVAPEGCDAFYVLSPVPHLKSGTDWATAAEPYRQAIEKRLEETVLPGLGEAVVTSKLMTPQDFRDRLLSVNGAAFSLEPKLFQSAWFRPHNKSEEADGLYLVGAGTHPGAGLPGVVTSAEIVDQLIPTPAPVA